MDYEATVALLSSLMRNILQLTERVTELEARLTATSDNGNNPATSMLGTLAASGEVVKQDK